MFFVDDHVENRLSELRWKCIPILRKGESYVLVDFMEMCLIPSLAPIGGTLSRVFSDTEQTSEHHTDIYHGNLVTGSRSIDGS